MLFFILLGAVLNSDGVKFVAIAFGFEKDEI